ncbi:hypothetical protein [Janibacter hoylei]|uniref:hypothetical protein n=1 Tax=Janibacter hoylei TaxID=364298 RepID=UPI0026C08CEB
MHGIAGEQLRGAGAPEVLPCQLVHRQQRHAGEIRRLTQPDPGDEAGGVGDRGPAGEQGADQWLAHPLPLLDHLQPGGPVARVPSVEVGGGVERVGVQRDAVTVPAGEVRQRPRCVRPLQPVVLQTEVAQDR